MSWPRPATRSAASSGRVCVRVHEADAHAAHGPQVAGFRRCLTELAPQPGQVDVDRAVATAVRLLPDFDEQLTPRDHLTHPRGQGQEQLELLPRQLEGLAAKTGRPGACVDGEIADDVRPRSDVGPA